MPSPGSGKNSRALEKQGGGQPRANPGTGEDRGTEGQLHDCLLHPNPSISHAPCCRERRQSCAGLQGQSAKGGQDLWCEAGHRCDIWLQLLWPSAPFPSSSSPEVPRVHCHPPGTLAKRDLGCPWDLGDAMTGLGPTPETGLYSPGTVSLLSPPLSWFHTLQWQINSPPLLLLYHPILPQKIALKCHSSMKMN